MKVSRKELSLHIIVISLLLCIPAFYNGFPLLFPDSGSYISSGFKSVIQHSRPWLYGGFIRHASLSETLWLVIFVQGALITGVVYLMFRAFYRGKNNYNLFIVYMVTIGMTTALSFHVSRLMPDIFTPIVILTFCLLLLGKRLTKGEYLVTIVLFIFSTAMHNANLILSIGLILSIVGGYVLKSLRVLYANLGITRKKIGWLSMCVLCTHLFVCTLHYSKGGGFEATKGGSIFLFARLFDMDIAQNYLRERCAQNSNSEAICNHNFGMNYGGHFLWDKNSYLNKTGGWTAQNEADCKEFVFDILTTPKYLKSYLIRSIEGMFTQLFFFEYSPVEPHIAPIADVARAYFPMYRMAALGNHQFNNNFNPYYININNLIQQIVIGIACVILFLLFRDSNYSNEHKTLAFIIIFALLINAFIASATSGIYDRYQSRVNWLITMPACWFVASWINRRVNKLKE